MNRTLLTLTGLLLAAPLAAQQPSANEMKASELLQLSAQKAMAGHEADAAKLAEMAMELLATKGTPEKGEIHMVIEENDNHLKGNVVIVDGPDGREVIEYISSEDIAVGSVDSNVEWEAQVELGSGGNFWHESTEDGEGNMEVIVMRNPHQQDGGEWRTDPRENVIWMTDREDHHYAPMGGGDLHQQLREIQHELESLRHELHALRSEMGGGRRGGMQGNRRMMRFNGGGGNWRLPEGNHDLRGGARLHSQHDFEPGQMQRIELHGMEGLPQNLRLHTLGLDGLEGLHSLEGIMELQGMDGVMELKGLHGLGEMHRTGEMGELHEMHFGDMDGADFDFDFEVPEGAEMHKEVVVIINGEKFTGDAAMKKLEELNMGDMGKGEGKIRMRVMGQGGALPTPPAPPKPPQRSQWRSKGHNHEDA